MRYAVCGQAKFLRNMLFVFLMAALRLLAPEAAEASQLVFDNFSSFENGVASAKVTATSFTPNTFMGDAYTLVAGTTDITGLDIYPVNLSGTTYDALKMNIFIWGSVNTSGTVNATTPAFSDLLGSYTFTSTGSFNSGFFFPMEGTPDAVNPGIVLGSPLAIPSTTIGITFNYEGSIDGGATYNNINDLSSLISYGVPPNIGSDVFSGFYQNANGETDGNFTSLLRTLRNPDEGLAVRFYGDVASTVPEPSSLALLVLGTISLIFRRRSKIKLRA